MLGMQMWRPVAIVTRHALKYSKTCDDSEAEYEGKESISPGRRSGTLGHE